MRRTTAGALLAAALLAGPATATAAAQPLPAVQATAVTAAPAQGAALAADSARDDDDGGGGWGLWGLLGLLGLLGLIPRKSKGGGAAHRGNSPGTGTGAHPTDRI